MSPVELDWLDLPRFQDTLRSPYPIAEDIFCEKFQKLLPFYYNNSTWYQDILKFDGKLAQTQALGCEPGFLRTIKRGMTVNVEIVDCYKRSPLVAWLKDGDVDAMWLLRRPWWELEDWNGRAPSFECAAGSKIQNAFSMEERAKAIEACGGQKLESESLAKFWDCWSGAGAVDCAWPEGLQGFAAYIDEDWDHNRGQRRPR